MDGDRPSARYGWRAAFAEDATTRVLLGVIGPTAADVQARFAGVLRDAGYEVIVLGAKQSYAGLEHAAVDEDVDLVVAIDDSAPDVGGTDRSQRGVERAIEVLVVTSGIDVAELLAQAAGRRRQM